MQKKKKKNAHKKTNKLVILCSQQKQIFTRKNNYSETNLAKLPNNVMANFSDEVSRLNFDYFKTENNFTQDIKFNIPFKS